jgi:hypothetical protein
MTVNKSSIFRFDDVEVRERELSLVKAGKGGNADCRSDRLA